MQCNQESQPEGDDDQLKVVLDAVRATGMSAHPKPGQAVSDLVLILSIDHGWNPVAIQRKVNAYARAREARS